MNFRTLTPSRLALSDCLGLALTMTAAPAAVGSRLLRRIIGRGLRPNRLRVFGIMFYPPVRMALSSRSVEDVGGSQRHKRDSVSPTVGGGIGTFGERPRPTIS